MGRCSAGAGPWGANSVSADRFFRASARRVMLVPPMWVDRAMIRAAALSAVYEMPAPERETADTRSGRDGSAPEGTSGAGVGHMGSSPANADQSWTEQDLPSPATASPVAVGEPGPVPCPLSPPAQAPIEPDPPGMGLVRKAPARPDWGRVVAVARGRALGAPARKAPTRVAEDKGPCPRCGIPGVRGCDHQLPYDEAAL